MFFAIGCAGSGAEKITLTVSAAASLKDSLGEIGDIYSKKYPNITLSFNFGASGTLQQQIEQGAPADVFISAGKKQMNALLEKDLLLSNSNKDLLKNEVVLIAPLNSKIKGFEDLKMDSIKKVALGEPKSVPVGQYSEEILKFYNMYDDVVKKAVYGKDVKEVLTWVEGENAEAGMVYKTDAIISKSVKIVISAPPESHTLVTYPIGIVKATKYQKQSEDFSNFLFSEEAMAIFEKYGFLR